MAENLTKIMYVEDEEYLRQIVEMALERVGGFNITTCASGTDALALLDEVQPDLILLDVRLPGMTGQALLTEIRKRDDFKATPVIYVTASVMYEELDEYRNSDAIDVISRPFDPMTLSDRIREVWERHHGT